MAILPFFSQVLDFLFPLRDGEKVVREINTETFVSRLSPVLKDTTTPATVALLPFHDRTVRTVIHEAKYRGNKKALALLGEALGEYLLELAGEDGRLVIVPVPLSEERQKERGFNQCEEIARNIPELSIPILAGALMRTKNTEHQTRLSRKRRRENANGAFSCIRTSDGKLAPLDPTFSYIVLDDVITTGATLQAAIDALRLAGAARIIPIALAH